MTLSGSTLLTWAMRTYEWTGASSGGRFGNLYHHYLLRTLRDDDSNKKKNQKYKVPMGGFFSACGGVAAPHYLFELISWWGIGVCTRHFISFLFNIAAQMQSAATANLCVVVKSPTLKVSAPDVNVASHRSASSTSIPSETLVPLAR